MMLRLTHCLIVGSWVLAHSVCGAPPDHIANSEGLGGTAPTVKLPDEGKLQELFHLSVRQRQLQLDQQHVKKKMQQLEQELFAGFERVADPIGSDYWEATSDTVLFAKGTRDIQKNELLLYHAPGIYRVKSIRPVLVTDGECWYFRPDRDIKAGEEFTIIPVAVEGVTSDPENIPNRNLARKPGTPLRTKIQIPGKADR